ncbi:type II/IV secretion system protein [bacterium]|nr:type II/IV secretion system protein [bacterium]
MDIIQQLVKNKIVSPQTAIGLRTKIRQTQKTAEEIILEEKIMPEDTLFELKSHLLKIPFRREMPDSIPPRILEIISKESAQYYKAVPLEIKNGVLEIGMVYPERIEAQEALKFLARQQKFEYKIFLITLSGFKSCIAKYRAPKQEMKRALAKLEAEIKAEKGTKISGKAVKFKATMEEAPVIKIVAVILKQAVDGKASDIHIEPTKDNLRVRYRLDGILHSSLLLPKAIHPAIVVRIKILSGLKIDETRIPQDGRFSANIGGEMIDFRVSTFPTTLGEKIAIRVLDPSQGLKSLTDLGLSERNFKLVKEAITKPYGMILVTGPTSSGKTTTLYSILRNLNKDQVNVVTLEDPVEYSINGVSQSQIKPEINYTFARGLRQILRQDPDVIMVGEIRDKETAELAVHAALTGHIVLSTLHTNNALGAIPRLIDMGIEPFLIPPSLLLVLSQRLVRVLCPFCKKKVKADKKMRDFILKKIESLPQEAIGKMKALKQPLYLYEPKGCKKCKFKGYAGRTGVFEVLKMTDDLARILTSGMQRDRLLAEAKSQGMVSMEMDGILKALEGVTSVEEVMRVIKEKS